MRVIIRLSAQPLDMCHRPTIFGVPGDEGDDGDTTPFDAAKARRVRVEIRLLVGPVLGLPSDCETTCSVERCLSLEILSLASCHSPAVDVSEGLTPSLSLMAFLLPSRGCLVSANRVGNMLVVGHGRREPVDGGVTGSMGTHWSGRI